MKIEPVGKITPRKYGNGVFTNCKWYKLPECESNLYTEAQLRQAMEACASVCESRQTPGTGSVDILNGAADEILEMIKEMLP